MSEEGQPKDAPWRSWRLGTRWWVVSAACLLAYMLAMIGTLMQINQGDTRYIAEAMRGFPEAALEVLAVREEYFRASHRLTAFVIAIAATSVAFWLGRVASRRMERVRAAVSRLAAGDLQTPVELSAVRDFEELGAALENIRQELGRRVEAEQRHQHLRQQLEASQALRELFTPGAGPQRVGRFEVTPHGLHGQGGSAWMLREGAGGRLLLGVGTVTGEGLGVTLLTGALTTAFHAADDRELPDLQPQAILTRVQIAFDHLSQGRFKLRFTALCLERSGWAYAASTGALNLWHFRRDAGWRPLNPGELRAVQLVPGEALAVGRPGERQEVAARLRRWCPQGRPSSAAPEDDLPLLHLAVADPAQEARA